METSPWLGGLAIAAGLLLASGPQVLARSHYSEAFRKTYDKDLSGNAAATQCTVCHYGPVKRSRNDYGKAIAKALKIRNERDAAAIRAALEEAAKQPSAVKGKTFGDLIKEGKLPGKNPYNNRPQETYD